MKRIEDVMSKPPHCCNDNENLQTVANQMAIHNIGFMPVVDINKKVIGTITDRDICLELGSNGKTAEDSLVKEAMETGIVTIKIDDNLNKALQLMRKQKVGRLPVIDEQKRVQGVITLDDILRGAVGQNDMAEISFRGTESVINTMLSLAQRNQKIEHEEVFGEEE